MNYSDMKRLGHLEEKNDFSEFIIEKFRNLTDKELYFNLNSFIAQLEGYKDIKSTNSGSPFRWLKDTQNPIITYEAYNSMPFGGDEEYIKVQLKHLLIVIFERNLKLDENSIKKIMALSLDIECFKQAKGLEKILERTKNQVFKRIKEIMQ